MRVSCPMGVVASQGVGVWVCRVCVQQMLLQTAEGNRVSSDVLRAMCVTHRVHVKLLLLAVYQLCGVCVSVLLAAASTRGIRERLIAGKAPSKQTPWWLSPAGTSMPWVLISRKGQGLPHMGLLHVVRCSRCCFFAVVQWIADWAGVDRLVALVVGTGYAHVEGVWKWLSLSLCLLVGCVTHMCGRDSSDTLPQLSTAALGLVLVLCMHAGASCS